MNWKNLLRWLRFWLWYRPLAWLRRERLYVDARAGNDDSPGTATAPIRTLAELSRRTHGRVLRGDLFVQLEGDFDESLELDMGSREGVVVTVAGGDERARREHVKRAKRFAREYWENKNVSPHDFPEPPASVGGAGQIRARRARIEALRFGKRKER